jgi:amino acid transporter
VPTTWQGFLVILGFFALALIPTSLFTKESSQSEASLSAYYMVYFIILLILFIAIIYKTGPKPKWRWGKKETDNPKEDF